MLKAIAVLIVLAMIVWSCYHVVSAAADEKEQDSRRATGLYVAAVLLILFGITGAGFMFG